MLLLLPLMAGVLFLTLRPRLGEQAATPEGDARSLRWTREQRITLAVFGLTAAGWIGAAPLGRALGITADVEMIPIQQINESYERMLRSDVKYRFVIDMASLKAMA